MPLCSEAAQSKRGMLKTEELLKQGCVVALEGKMGLVRFVGRTECRLADERLPG